jgi:hypothetical protein
MNMSRILFGPMLVTLGLLLLADRYFGTMENLFSHWWPLAFVSAGIAHFVSRPRYLFGSFTLVLLGFILLNIAGAASGDIFALVWPALLVAGGALMLVRPRDFFRRAGSDNRQIRAFTALNRQHLTAGPDVLSRASVIAVLGATVLDLGDAKMSDNNDSLVQIFTCLGNVRILVPQTWYVSAGGLPLLGGWSNKTYLGTSAYNNESTLSVYVVSLLGWVTIDQSEEQ